MIRTTILSVLSVLSWTFAFSQDPDWIPTPEYFSVTSYDQFPGAEAVFLLDHGYLTAYKEDGMVMKYTGIIHVLKEGGKELAEMEFAYPESENISIGYASAYNLGANGEVEESELLNRDIYREKFDEGYSIVRFAVPKVKVGTIIKFSYTRTKKSLFSSTWRFQGSIPVLKSELTFVSDNELGYSYVFQGSMLDKFSFDGQRLYRMENIPASREEPFVPNEGKYEPQLRFQLTEYLDRSTGRVEQVFPSWDKFGEELLSKDYYQLSKKEKKAVVDLAEEIIGNKKFESALETSKYLYDFVKGKFEWDGQYSWDTEQDLVELIESRTGNSASINHLLYALLISQGMEAHPAILPTRGRSIPIENYPLSSQFNALVVHLEIDEEQYTLDATNPFRPFGLPAIPELNRRYVVLEEGNTRWEDINISQSSNESCIGILTLAEDGSLTGSLTLKHTGYRASIGRAILNQRSMEEFWSWRLGEEFDPSWITTSNVEGKYDADSILTVQIDLSIPEAALVTGDMIFLQPIIINRIVENPFNQEERLYPVDFSYPKMNSYSVRIIIPDGYEFEESPKPGKLVIPDERMSFVYNSEQVENTVYILSQVSLRETYYERNYHSALVQMYDEMMRRHGQQLVLRKKEAP